MPVPTTKPLPPRPLLRTQARDVIRAAILDGTLHPGERLRDDELIAWVGSSRTPIREALGALTHEGLIEMNPHRDTRVVAPKADDFHDALESLGIIFGGVIRLALPVITNEQRRSVVTRLAAELARISDGFPPRDAVEAHSVYRWWLDLCPNRSLAAIGEQALHGLTFRLRVDTVDEFPTAHLFEQLTAFRDAIDGDDAVSAQHAFRAAHLVAASPRQDQHDSVAPPGHRRV